MIYHYTDPKDYTSAETDLTFTPESSRLCVNIPITNDTVVEGNETFTVTVTSNDTTVQTGPNSNSTVTIIDNDGRQCRHILNVIHWCFTELTIGFDPSTYTVNETDMTVQVCASIQDGSLQRDAVVTLSTSDGTATGNSRSA